MDLLRQLGITKEEMLERITDRALGITADHRQTGEESWDDIPFSSVVDRNIKDAIERLVASMESKISERIDLLLNEKMIEVFERAYQPVDRWGKPVGPMTTVRDIKATLIGAYGDLVARGILEDQLGFAQRVIVERDTVNTNRVNALLPIDAVNALDIFAGNATIYSQYRAA